VTVEKSRKYAIEHARDPCWDEVESWLGEEKAWIEQFQEKKEEILEILDMQRDELKAQIRSA